MKEAIKNYAPLIWILLLCALMAAAFEERFIEFSLRSWMHSFMGFFFVLLSLFKLVNLSGFADGYQRYDLLAKHSRPYAYLYPFLELALGLAYLGEILLVSTYIATIGLMLFGLVGILLSMKRGYQFECACLGTVLKVKLSTISILENFGMAAMAAWMWWQH